MNEGKISIPFSLSVFDIVIAGDRLARRGEIPIDVRARADKIVVNIAVDDVGNKNWIRWG
jgi:hypothetical protein